MTCRGKGLVDMDWNQLENWLSYMNELQYGGLALKESPFVMPQPAPVLRGPGAGAPMPRAAAKVEPPVKQTANLFSIMDLAQTTSPGDETKRKVEMIRGNSKVDVLRNLFQAFSACQACALGTTRNQFVFGEGDADAPIMFVGEGPGFEEDRSGRPFVGRAGQLLDKVIQAMGYQREQVFIANVVKCRPPNNRTPLPDETAACSPILYKQIQTVNPKVLIALGSTGLRFFAGPGASIMRMRGRWLEWEGFPVMPTFHPAYVLRNPVSKREVWEDMKLVIAKVKELTG